MNACRINGFSELDETKMCYWKEDNIWYLYLPKCGLGNLSNHQVIEHEDGTISASPSILVTGHASGDAITMHGYLEHGVWRDC